MTEKEVPYNWKVMRWAREWRNRTLEETAARVGTSVERVASWEAGTTKPTVIQARKMAAYYDRPFLEFFLPEPPTVNEPPQLYDYRLYSGQRSLNDREVQPIVRWADEMRLNALGLYELLDEEPPIFPTGLLATADADPEDMAKQVRAAVSFSIEEQMSLPAARQRDIPQLMRRAVEELGVLVLRRNELTQLGARGMCFYDPTLPLIVYGKEAPVAQAFTIAHELGHVLWQESSISGKPVPDRRQPSNAGREAWCNRFAAAFLMPREQIRDHMPAKAEPQGEFDDVELDNLARLFSVSAHAMLIRLVQLGYVKEDYYWDVKRPQFLEYEQEATATFGRAAYYGVRYRSAVGDTYTGLVISALHAGRITNHTAAQFMGIKNLQHFNDVMENFPS